MLGSLSHAFMPCASMPKPLVFTAIRIFAQDAAEGCFTFYICRTTIRIEAGPRGHLDEGALEVTLAVTLFVTLQAILKVTLKIAPVVTLVATPRTPNLHSPKLASVEAGAMADTLGSIFPRTKTC